MCFYNGIDISRAQHITLKKKEKKLQDPQLNLHQPLASGFDYPIWPVLKPIENGQDVEIEMMHWEFIPSYIKSAEARVVLLEFQLSICK